MQTLIPAHIIVGPETIVYAHVEQFLQKKFCRDATTQPTCFCTQCRKIKARQHHAIVWICPEKAYTVEDVDIIFERTALALNENEECFFILDKTQTLTSATANRLLKVLEEPPRGYQFILLTNNIDALLPTIVSRCMITSLAGNQETEQGNPLLAYFSLEHNFRDPFAFEQELKKQHLSDTQSLELLHQLISTIMTRYKKTHQEQQFEHYTKEILDFVLVQAKTPPQSGSSELFWKNLYLSWPQRK
jgi:hypothetical protein